MAAAKNGAAKIGGAFRQALQALLVPELRQHGERLAAIEAHLVGVKTEIVDLRESVKTEIGDLRQSLKTEIGDLRQSLETEIGDLRESVKTEIGDLRLEASAQIGDLRREMSEVKGLLQRIEDKLDVRERLAVVETRLAALESRQN